MRRTRCYSDTSRGLALHSQGSARNKPSRRHRLGRALAYTYARTTLGADTRESVHAPLSAEAAAYIYTRTSLGADTCRRVRAPLSAEPAAYIYTRTTRRADTCRSLHAPLSAEPAAYIYTRTTRRADTCRSLHAPLCVRPSRRTTPRAAKGTATVALTRAKDERSLPHFALALRLSRWVDRAPPYGNWSHCGHAPERWNSDGRRARAVHIYTRTARRADTCRASAASQNGRNANRRSHGAPR